MNDLHKQMLELKKYVNDPDYIEGISDLSILLYQKYIALIKSGFSSEQAFQLILEHGIGWGVE